MYTCDHSIDVPALRALVEQEYGVSTRELCFVPLGRDSWAFRAETLFVSVRRDFRGHAASAYVGARKLHDAGLAWVVAPLAGASGTIVHRCSGHPVLVFPFIDDGEQIGASDAASAIRVIRALHAADLDQQELGREQFDPKPVRDLRRQLEHHDWAADAGPFAARVIALLTSHADRLLALCALIDRLAGECRDGSTSDFVVSHGDPSAQNFIRAATGHLMLCDWGDLAIGPPERDLFHLSRTLGGQIPMRPERHAYYAALWQVSEIAEYATILTRPHDRSADTVQMLRELCQYVTAVEPADVRGGEWCAAPRPRATA